MSLPVSREKSVYKLEGISASRRETDHSITAQTVRIPPLEPFTLFLSLSFFFICSLSPKQHPTWLLYNLPRVSAINHRPAELCQADPSPCIQVSE